MALSTAPKTVAPLDEGYLNDGISASAATITVAPIYKYINGVKTKQGFNTTSGVAIIEFSGKKERISFESNSVDATTKVSTLGTCTRGLSLTSTTTSYAAGTGMAFPKGAKITVVQDVGYIHEEATTGGANTFTAKQTFSTVDFTTDGDEYLRLPSLTTTERNALTPANGMMIYNETTGQFEKYEGGAWGTDGSTTVADGSTTVAGKFEEATVAEQGAATATGATGARLVLAAANLVKTSSGAGDENKLAVLDSSGNFASGFLPTVPVAKGGTNLTSVGTTGNVLTSNGTAWVSSAPVFDLVSLGGISAATSSVGASSTNNNAITETAVTLSSLAVGDKLYVRGTGRARLDAGTLIMFIQIGGTNLWSLITSGMTTGALKPFSFNVMLTVRNVTSSGKIIAGGTMQVETIDFLVYHTDGSSAPQEATVDFTTDQVFRLTAQFSDSNANHSVILDQYSVIRERNT